MTSTTHGELKNTGYEIFMLLVSLLSIVNLAFLILPFGDSRSKEVVVVIDAILIPVFVADFIYRLATAPSRSWYFLRGWGGQHGPAGPGSRGIPGPEIS